ncbi:MAG: glycosyltransferase family 4 protein [Candidatus Latescibacteria bacterium]|nr:glycosyltransferase family 4 protein [Candidatus Latescibacterota bacterium]
MICIKYGQELTKENVEGVNVYRIPLKRKRSGKIRYFWEYSSFLFLSFILLSYLHLRNKYDIIHVHNMPEFLVYSAIIPKITGSKIILDMHDPTPEIFITKYNIDTTDFLYRFLVYMEKKSIKFSHLVFTPNIAFYKLFIKRGCPESKIHIIMNSPDEKIFNIHSEQPIELQKSNKDFIVMYHGFIAERNGLDSALKAISDIKNKIPGLVFNVYGDGDFTDRFLEIIDELNIKDVVNYYGIVPLEKIAEAIESIDLGIIPNKLTPFTEINFPTRIFEYLSKYKPVIAPKTTGILDYFNDESIFFFKPGDAKDLSEKIMEIYNNPSHVQKVIKRGKIIHDEHSWEKESQHLVQLVEKLLQTFNKNN